MGKKNTGRVVFAVLLAAALLLQARTADSHPSAGGNVSCSTYALADYVALTRHLTRSATRSGTRYFEHSGSDVDAPVWPHSQAAAAAMDVAVTCGGWATARLSVAGLERFRRGRSYDPYVRGRDHDRFYDDNAWIGLDLIQAFEISGEARYLERAKRVFSFLERGFSPHGGIYWNEDLEENLSWRNAATNGPALQLALHLFDQTGNARYLDRAMELDAFLNRELRNPDGLLLDGVSDDGFVDRRLWTYNQGTYIGASVQLYELTGDPEYIGRAVETASAAIARFGAGDRLWRQPPAFNAIFFRNLLDLDAIAPDPSYRAALDAYLARARATARTGLGLYQGGGLGFYGNGLHVQLVDQAAFVQMHALLGMSPAQLAIVS
jgi:uncharacterized protein YyaL (SSP411 family)